MQQNLLLKVLHREQSKSDSENLKDSAARLCMPVESEQALDVRASRDLQEAGEMFLGELWHQMEGLLRDHPVNFGTLRYSKEENLRRPVNDCAGCRVRYALEPFLDEPLLRPTEASLQSSQQSCIKMLARPESAALQ